MAKTDDVRAFCIADSMASDLWNISQYYYNMLTAYGDHHHLDLEHNHSDWETYRQGQNEYENTLYSLYEGDYSYIENYLNDTVYADDDEELTQKAERSLAAIKVFREETGIAPAVRTAPEAAEEDYLNIEPIPDKSYAEQLYTRVNDEYSGFIGQMKKESAEVLIEAAAEIVDKDRIRLYLEEYNPELTDEQFEALLSRNYPLDEIYEQWVKMGELHSIEDLGISLEETADRILISLNCEREEKDKSNPEAVPVNKVD